MEGPSRASRRFARIMADSRYRRSLVVGSTARGIRKGSFARISRSWRKISRCCGHARREDVWRSRVLMYAHDTFKPDAIEGVANFGPRSHASPARSFLEEFGVEAELLVIAGDPLRILIRGSARRLPCNEHRRIGDVLVGGSSDRCRPANPLAAGRGQRLGSAPR